MECFELNTYVVILREGAYQGLRARVVHTSKDFIDVIVCGVEMDGGGNVKTRLYKGEAATSI